jgi:hypothetical protein
MTLAVLSLFRNAGGKHGQAVRFVTAVGALRDALAPTGDVQLIAVYGDSRDDTGGALRRAADQAGVPLRLVESNHGGPVFGSTESTRRLQALSQVGNAGLQAVTSSDDFVWYVESDLLWAPPTVLHLLAVLDARPDLHLVAPLVMAGTAFYDTWGFRRDGQRFGPFMPYHPAFDQTGLTSVDSVGSAFLCRGAVARASRMTDQALVSFCESAREHGYCLAVDARVQVRHP